MSNFQEFSYYEIKRRPLLFVNAYLTLFVLTVIFTGLVIAFKYNFFYESFSSILFLVSILGLFAGNLIGKFLFKKLKNATLLYYASEISFLLFILAFLLVPRITSISISQFYAQYTFIFFPAMFVLMLAWGIKINYFLKIGCGDFVDEKQALFDMLGSTLLGVLSGLLFVGFLMTGHLDFAQTAILIFVGISIILLLGSMFFIKFKYNPHAMYLKDFSEHGSDAADPLPVNILKDKAKDSLLFIYLNFSIILIFLFMIYQTYIKVFGTSLYSSVIFTICLCISFLLGYLIGRIRALRISHVIAQFFIPIVFIIFYYILIGYSSAIIEFKYYFIILIIPLTVFGYIMIQNFRIIMDKFPHDKRFEIMNFGLMILPVPIGIVLLFINFTNMMFAILMYVLLIICLMLPGLYYFNKSDYGYGFKKIKFLVYVLVLISILIIGHISYKIPIDGDLYVNRTQNFRELQAVNFSANYIKNKTTVFLNGEPIFFLSDSSIKNMVRSALSVAVYHRDMQKDILIIDGNQSYFANPVFSLFKNSVIINPLTEKNVDYKKLSLSGMPVYASHNIDPSYYLYKYDRKFFTIMENPNITDQSLNSYKFSNEYYSLLKERLADDGIFAVTFNLENIRKEFLSNILYLLNEKYKFHRIYIFSEKAVILNSDKEASLQIVPEQIQLLNKLVKDRRYIMNNTFSAAHLLSHYYGSELNFIEKFYSDKYKARYYYFNRESDNDIFNTEFFEKYFLSNSEILNTLDVSEKYDPAFNDIKADLVYRKDVFTLLKRLEYSEAMQLYEEETEYLFVLKRYIDYMNDLKPYINNLLANKEEYYYNAAFEFEKNKNWEGAKTLYQAVLKINPNNFNANYRLGILSLTLQEFDNSFNYLKTAIGIKNNHPEVLYQLGYLLFTMNKTNEALNYFNKAVEANERSSSLFYYMGLCFERLGRTNEAVDYYKKALIEDPNNLIVKEKLDDINRKNQRKSIYEQFEQKNQLEEEKGERIPLPVNKSAYDIRLDEENLEKIPIYSGETGQD